MFRIDIVKQEYIWWYSYISSIDNDINLLRLISDTWVIIGLVYD